MIENKRIQLRRDTSDNWYVSNPILLEGEIGVDLTYNIIKIGDGSTHWNDIDEWHTINNMGAVNSDIESALYNLKSEELPSIIFERLQEYTYSQYQIDNVIEGAKDALQANIDTKVDNDTYQAKISEIEGNIEGKADQGDTYTKEEVDRLIAGAGAGVTKEYVDGEISRVEGEIPSLEGYATEAWVEGKGYLTEHQSLDNYYTKEETDNAIQGTKTALEGEINAKVDTTTYEGKISEIEGVLEVKADRSEIPSLSGYATESWVEGKGYLTEHQPLKTINGEEIVGEGDIEIKGSEQEFKAFSITQDTFKTNQEFLNAVEDVVNSYNPIGRYAIKNGDYPYVCEEFHVSGTDVILVFVEHAQTQHSIIKISMDKTSGTWDGVWTGINGLADYYTKAETNTKLDDKLNKDKFETKMGEVDTALAGKVDHNEFTQRCETIEQSIPTTTEQWTFELEDGTNVNKEVYIK